MKRKILFGFILFVVLLAINISVQASNENVKCITETMSNYDGSVKLNLSEMTLDTTHKYSFGISSEKSTEWFIMANAKNIWNKFYVL